MKLKLIAFCGIMAAIIQFSMGFSADSSSIDLSKYRVDDMELFYTVPNEDEVLKIVKKPARPFELYLGNTYFGFKEALGFKESQGDYSVVNPFGYMGKYQFSASTLEMIGIYDASDFLTDTRLQEAAFDAYTARNKWILRRDIKRYVGKKINGVRVTESGILAAAHLAGAGNVKKYLRSGGAHAFSDAFGTTIGYYLKKFSGFDTTSILPNRRSKVRII